MPSIYDWKLNPDDNQTVDTLAWWKEGQPPSTVNNSARGMMTRVAELLGDSLGTIKASLDTEGAYSVTINSKIEAYDPRLKFEVFFPVVGLKTPRFKVNELTALPMVKRQISTALSEGKTGAGFVYTLKVLDVSDMYANAIHILKFIPPDIAKAMAPKGNTTDYGSGVFLVETLSGNVVTNPTSMVTASMDKSKHTYAVNLDSSISVYDPSIKLEVYFPQSYGLVGSTYDFNRPYFQINSLPALPMVKNQRDLADSVGGYTLGVTSKFMVLHSEDILGGSIHTIRYIPPDIAKAKAIKGNPADFSKGVFLVETAEEQRLIRWWRSTWSGDVRAKIFADFTCELYAINYKVSESRITGITQPYVVFNYVTIGGNSYQTSSIGGGRGDGGFATVPPSNNSNNVSFNHSGTYSFTLIGSIWEIIDVGVESPPPFLDISQKPRSTGQR